LQYKDQSLNESVRIGMKQIAARGGYPSVFRLERDGDGLWLDSYWAKPGREWRPDDGFVFRFRKVEAWVLFSLLHFETLNLGHFDSLASLAKRVA
jgi:hypothetical protein